MSHPPQKEKVELRCLRSMLRGHWIALLVLVGFWAFFFREIIFGGQQFCLRDGAYFYYSLFQYIHSIWQSGNLPLWDTCENLGQPLAAIPTSSVFYPGQIIFCLPLGYDTCYAWYHLLHLLLAPLGMFLLCRHWKITLVGSLIATLAYGFCGSVFGQYCNTIFLVGAAWFPLGIYFGDRLLQKGNLRSLAGLGLILALMVLGGEPQTAYFTGLLLGALWFVYYRSGLFVSTARLSVHGQLPLSTNLRDQGISRFFPLFKSRLALLVYAAILGGLIAGIQIIPTLEMTKHSDRDEGEIPLSLWKVPGFIAQREFASFHQKENFPPIESKPNPYQFYETPNYSEKSTTSVVLDGLFCRTIEYGGHPRVVYQFSLGPWHLMELFWPNSNGRASPGRSRWSSFLPEDGVWTYSLYMGIIPLLLALSVFCGRIKRPSARGEISSLGTIRNSEIARIERKKNKHREQKKNGPPISAHRAIRVWCTWVIILSFLAALGGYGPYWILRALSAMMGNDVSLTFSNGDPVGGLYWFFCVFLPMFASFRFPAKMIMPGILALAVLAGFGWDVARRNRRLPRLTQYFILISVCLLSVVFMMGSKALEFPEKSTAAILGGYDAQVAWYNLMGAIVHSLLVALAFVVIVFKWSRRQRTISVAMLTVLLLGADLYLANWNLLLMTSPELFHQEPLYVSLIRERRLDSEESLLPLRYFRYTWSPSVLISQDARCSIQEQVTWEHHTLMPKYQCLYGLHNIYSTGTMMEKEYSIFAEWLHWFIAQRDMTPITAWLGSRFSVFPIVIQDDQGIDRNIVLSNKWAILLSSSKDFDSNDSKRLITGGKPVSATLWETTLPTTRVHILRNATELDRPDWTLIDQLESGQGNAAFNGEYAKITRYQQNTLTLEVLLTQPGEIVLAEQYFKGWQATVRSLEYPEKGESLLEIKKTLGFLRRVSLPAGRFEVQMSYCPSSFSQGAAASCIGLFAFVLLLFFPWEKRYAHLSNGR